jgi:hypothetical protein
MVVPAGYYVSILFILSFSAVLDYGTKDNLLDQQSTLGFAFLR